MQATTLTEDVNRESTARASRTVYGSGIPGVATIPAIRKIS
jgi:hypothetical protein